MTAIRAAKIAAALALFAAGPAFAQYSGASSAAGIAAAGAASGGGGSTGGSYSQSSHQQGSSRPSYTSQPSMATGSGNGASATKTMSSRYGAPTSGVVSGRYGAPVATSSFANRYGGVTANSAVSGQVSPATVTATASGDNGFGSRSPESDERIGGSVGSRIGMNQSSRVGARMGGGTDVLPPENASLDPRDALEMRLQAFNRR